jgi:hypothetical protein
VHVHGLLDDLKMERIIHSNLKRKLRILHAAKQHEQIVAHASLAAPTKLDTTMAKQTTLAFQPCEKICARLMYHPPDFEPRPGIHRFC